MKQDSVSDNVNVKLAQRSATSNEWPDLGKEPFLSTRDMSSLKLSESACYKSAQMLPVVLPCCA